MEKHEGTSLDELSKQDWIIYDWVAVYHVGNRQPIMVQGNARTPNEAYQAAIEWDEWTKHKIFREQQLRKTNGDNE